MNDPLLRLVGVQRPVVVAPGETVSDSAAENSKPSPRLPALDWMRGLAVLLMVVGHGHSVFNAHKLDVESVASYQPGMALPADRSGWLLGLSLGFLVFGEVLTFQLWKGTWTDAPPAAGLLLAIGYYQSWMTLYPLVPWLAMMILGLVFGRRLAALRRDGERTERPAIRLLLAWGVGALAVFALVRGANGYGNMRLLREDGSLIQWLNLSKFPPSLSYTALTLGLMALCLAGLFYYQRTGRVWRHNPLLIFGQTAFFFYIAHWAFLVALSKVTGLNQKAGALEAYGAALVVLAVLYPACRLYRRYKTLHPGGWTRYF